MDYQSNSHKSKEEAAKKAEKPPKPEVKRVVKGEVVKKKRPIGSLFKEVFLGGDIHDVGDYVLGNIILPKLRDTLWEVISRGSGRWIFGDNRVGPSKTPTSYAGKVSYNTIPIQQAPDPRTGSPFLPARLPDQPRIRPANRAISNDFIFHERTDAEGVLEQMLNVLDEGYVVSMADFFEMMGLESTDHTDNKFGWSTLPPTIQIRQQGNGWIIDLPPLEEI